MLKPSYHTVMADVIRYTYLCREGFWEKEDETSDLPPAAAEALHFLTSRVADELSIPDWMARRGLLYAAGRHPYPARLVFISMSMQLQSVEASPA